MKREEYLEKLKLNLEGHDFGPVEEAIAYFNELLDDRMAEEGMDEDSAVASLESPEMAAEQLAQSRPETRKPNPEEDFVPGVRSISVKPSLVKNILVRDRNNRLILRGWDRDEILIKHPETEKIRYDFTLENGTLSLIRQPMELSIQLFQFESLSPEMREITLDVPRELAAAVDLRTSNGRVNAENLACWGSLDLKTSNGSLRLNHVSAKSVMAATSNGGISLEGVKADKALKAASSNGKITARGASAGDAILLSTSNGGIEVEDLNAPAFDFTTSNGGLKGTLPGRMSDYTITSATSNGKNSLPKHQEGGSRLLSARTSNARIQLAFSEGGEQPENSKQEETSWAEHLGRKAEDIGEKAGAAVEERLERFGQDLEQKVNQGAEKFEHLSERISKAVEDALSRVFDGKNSPPDGEAQP